MEGSLPALKSSKLIGVAPSPFAFFSLPDHPAGVIEDTSAKTGFDFDPFPFDFGPVAVGADLSSGPSSLSLCAASEREESEESDRSPLPPPPAASSPDSWSEAAARRRVLFRRCLDLVLGLLVVVAVGAAVRVDVGAGAAGVFDSWVLEAGAGVVVWVSLVIAFVIYRLSKMTPRARSSRRGYVR